MNREVNVMTKVSREVLLGLRNQLWMLMKMNYTGLRMEDREDLVQEAMIKVWKAGRMSNPGYVVKVVRSAAADHFRKEGRRSVHLDSTVEYDQLEGAVMRGEERIRVGALLVMEEDRYDAVELFEKCLAQLPKEQAEVMELLAQDLDYEEVAEVMGVKVGTVRSRLHYGRRRLTQYLMEA